MLSRYSQFLLFASFCVLISLQGHAQTAIWVEDFDDGGGGRWTLENAPGSLTNPTPAGIVGLVYGVNAAVEHDNFIINDRNTPELDNDIAIGTTISAQGQLVRGRHYACSSPSDLPNPYINGAQPGPNQSLHITSFPTCATLLYGGTPQSDDWNCISDPDNGDIQTQSEQIAYLNSNIDATGKCNLVLTADFFLGGDSDGIKAHSTILYSVDAGVTWQILQDSLSSCYHFLAGTCNNWYRRSFELPADANNQPDIRIAFRWVDDGDINDTGDYALGASFNVDNLIMSACDVPTAAFIVSQTTGCKGDVFYFTDQSTTGDGYYSNCASLISGVCDISAWSWSIAKPGPPGGFNYINGTSATDQHPQVEFTSNGTYDVTLTATNCAGDGILLQSAIIIIDDCPPTANFTTSQLAACADPASEQDTVTFTDLSASTAYSPITGWSWVFTPATVTYVNGTSSTDQNIDVVFDAIGTYQVALTVTNAEGNDTETKVAFIEALDCNCGGGGGGGPVTAFYEGFENGCGSGCSAHGVDTGNGAWIITDSSPAVDACGFTTSPNTFYVSCAENGNAATACGTGCAGGGDESLHLSSTTLGDLGAAYDTGGWCSFGLGGWGAGTDTDVFVESPVIDLSGISSNTVDFVYMENGSGTTDDATLWYYDGATWALLNGLAKTGLGCAPQGTWTAFSIALPASADNNANVKIGFRWVNNDDAVGSDPSFAVDDISINGTTGGGSPANTWEGDVSSVWNLAGNWSDNAIPTTATDALIPASICGGCAMPQIGATAVARDVCNFGTITINGDNTLTIDRDLLNEGVITTTTTVANADVIFANTISVYKGSGTLFDVDVSVTSSDLTLETNMWPRSMTISTSGTFDLATYVLSVNRDLSKSAGTFIAINGEVHFVNACGGCLDQTNTSDVTINANQVFGNVLVNKSTGIKASLVSAFNYTLNTPKTLTIQSGILDANTNTLNGTGNLTMTGGELQLAKCGTVLPELSGVYTLPDGKIQFDGTCAQSVKQTSVVGTDYFKVQFNGSGVKSLSGNTNIADSLIFTLPTGLGNYVDAGTDTLFVTNSSANIVLHTGGHVLGNYNRAFTSSGGMYIFHLGSNNSDAETYFEPLRFTPNLLTGNANVTTRFLDATPNPTTVVPSIVFGFPLSIDTVEQVETEGYWHMGVSNNVLGGNYTASVSPDINYWTFAQTWGSDAHTLLKQEIEGDAWDYTAGGSRVDDSTTMTFTDFSNYALGYTNNGALTPLSVDLANYTIYCEEGVTHLSWITVAESNSHSFIIEASEEGGQFKTIGQIPAAGNSSELIQYMYTDNNRSSSGVYYRLSEMDLDGKIVVHGVLFIDCATSSNSPELLIFPNPGQHTFNLNISSNRSGLGTIDILDLTGKTVYLDEMLIGKGANLKLLELDLLPGTYIVALKLNEHQLMQRLVIIE
ncbi:MAG: T9SS type A sorting domain-containing protein [Crocinitomicaceae bacterium]|nr:T9SS type A sorting domain-containing protein [Crocinitomicaceae bacterium]